MSGSQSSEDFWRTYSAYTSGYQSVDRLSDIDEFEESFKYLSVVDKTKHYYTLCRLVLYDSNHRVLLQILLWFHQDRLPHRHSPGRGVAQEGAARGGRWPRRGR